MQPFIQNDLLSYITATRPVVCLGFQLDFLVTANLTLLLLRERARLDLEMMSQDKTDI